MRHRFKVIKHQDGTISYKCKRCGNSYGGPYPTRIPCRNTTRSAITDKMLKRAKELANEAGKGENDE